METFRVRLTSRNQQCVLQTNVPKNDRFSLRPSIKKLSDSQQLTNATDTSDASTKKPKAEEVAFAYGCLVATMLGPAHFPAETDLENEWRDECLKVSTNFA